MTARRRDARVHGARRARRRRFVEGVRTSLTATLGTAIWGFVAGVAMVNAGLSVAQALAMTLLVYSGTMQLVALPLIAAGAPVALIVASAALSALRFVVYSAALAPDFGRLPARLRFAVGYLTVDSALAVWFAQRRHGRAQRTAFYLGANVPVWPVWTGSSMAGIAFAGLLPASDKAGFVAVLALGALVGPMLRARPEIAGFAAAAVVAVLGHGLPWRMGLLGAIVAGVVAAMLATPRGPVAAPRGA